MAGAGPISETLPVVTVPSMLVDGGRFLKWDDVSFFNLSLFNYLKKYILVILVNLKLFDAVCCVHADSNKNQVRYV